MNTKITDSAGVTMDGPEDPAVAVGMGHNLDAGQVRLIGGSVGAVAPRQQGILPGRIVISEDMVRRGRAAAPGLGLEPHHVRAILEAALLG